MISFEEYFLRESLDSPYPYTPTFFTRYRNGVREFDGEQSVLFRTSSGRVYEWTAEEHPHREGNWELVFGLLNEDDADRMKTGLTGTGDAMKVLSTIVSITNDFVREDTDNTIKALYFTAEGDSRTRLYMNRLKHIKGFSLSQAPEVFYGSITRFILKRNQVN